MSGDGERVVKKPCDPCPYSRKNTLWLHPERAEDFAYQCQSWMSDFVCHKTAVDGEQYDEDGQVEDCLVRGEHSATCCGFRSLQARELNDEDFTPHPDAFNDVDEMIDAHAEHWEWEQEQMRAYRAKRAK